MEHLIHLLMISVPLSQSLKMKALRGLFLNRCKSLLHAPANFRPTSPTSLSVTLFYSGSPSLQKSLLFLATPSASPLSAKQWCWRGSLVFRRSFLGMATFKILKWKLLSSILASLSQSSHLPSSTHQKALGVFDDILQDALTDLSGSPLPDWAWLKASLPSSLDGLNIRWASLHAPAAYIGSFLHSKPPILQILGYSAQSPLHFPGTISDLAHDAARPEWQFIHDIDVPLVQRCLSHAIDEASFATLLADAPDSCSRALALSSATRHARDWLNVVTSSALGLHLQDWEFCLCVQYWLGLQMSVEGSSCPVCHTVADPFGYHQVGCGGNGDRIYRHDALRDAVISAAQTSALVPWREMPSLIPDTQRHPADVFLPNWKRGRPAALDVCVISTMQQLTIQGAATVQGHALLVGEERKLAAHADACRAVGISFIPLVVETLGG